MSARNDSGRGSSPGLDHPALTELESLRTALEELQVADEELRQQNEELERLQEAVLRDRQRYLDLFEQAPDGYLVTDARGVVREANLAAARLLGVPTSSLIGKPLIRFVPIDQRRAFRTALNWTPPGGSARELNARLQRHDGPMIDVWISLSTVRDPRHAVVSLRWLLRDVTERMQIEAEVRALNAELEHRVQDRTTELLSEKQLSEELLQRAREAEAQARLHAATLEQRVRERTADLAEINEQLTAFTYSVSHNLRTPLRAVRGLAELLLEDYGPRLEPEGSDYARRMIEASTWMDAVIRDLLAYSHMSRLDLELHPVAIAEVVSRTLGGLAPEIERASATVEVVLPTELPRVLAHAGVLEQAVSNLLANAVKFVAPGVRPRISIKASAMAQCVRVTICDQGIGIAPAHHERIFGVFERLHRVDEFPGTGVGLAMVRKAVERFGGRTGVESRLGQGATFWIELIQARNDL